MYPRLLALILFGALVGLVALRFQPPAPLPTDAPSTEFSGARAMAELRSLIGDGKAHPVGSPEDARIREVLVSRLRSLGYSPEVQDTWVCGASDSCARVKNIVAVREGQRPDGKVVLVSAHYDSVPGGPAAADDMSGVVAILELARVLTAEPPGRNPVVLLINEGEEPGLLGAEAFMAEHPLARRVGAVVNMEARGTAGPSLMFETSDQNGKIIDLYAGAVRHPATNSLYYTVYKLLPNDTDHTVFKREGLKGLNFAFVAGESRYHTPVDDVAHLDPRTLQHQGENGLALVRAFAAADLDSLEAPDRIWFDFLNLAVVRFPESWIRPLGILGALLAAGAVAIALRRRWTSTRAVLLGGAAMLLSLLLAGAIGALFAAILRLSGAAPYLFLAESIPARFAFAIVGVLGAELAASWLAPRATDRGLWLGWVALSALLGLLASLLVPGLAYPMVLTALGAGAVALFLSATEGVRHLDPASAKAFPLWAWTFPFVLSLALWLPISWPLYDALGTASFPGWSLLIAISFSGAAAAWGPMRRLRHWLQATVALALIFLGWAIVAPRYTVDFPQKLNLEYRVIHEDGKPPRAGFTAIPLGGVLPEPLVAAGKLSAATEENYPWPSFLPAHVGPGPVLPLTPPTFTVESVRADGDHLRVRGALHSVRGALNAGLVLPAARLLNYSVEGKPAHKQKSKNLVPKLMASGEWTDLWIATADGGPVTIELELTAGAPIAAWTWDASAGLPEEARALIEARPPEVMPYQAGDRTLAIQQVTVPTAAPSP